MFAVISSRKDDGTYSEVGTNHRWITGEYATFTNLVRYQLKGRRANQYRFEVWYCSKEYFYRTEPGMVKFIDWEG